MCYAESRDGIEWYRPELGLVNFQGSTRNNIVWDGIGAHNFAPFRDRNPDCREGEEYKALGSALARTAGEQALYAFKSADGVHWSLLSEKPVITAGRLRLAEPRLHDPLRGCYVDYHRDSIHPGRRARAQHHDLHLEGLPPLDEAAMARLRRRAGRAPLHERGYTLLPGPAHLHGIPQALRSRPPHARQHGRRRLGRRVHDQPRRPAFQALERGFLRPGLQPERWENRNNMTAWGILETANDLPTAPKELSIFTTEGYYRGDACRLRRFTLRLDGFVSGQRAAERGAN